MRPYQAALAISGIVYGYSIVFCLYYILPVDELRHKFIPGQ
jgi:hypothetical protein